MIEPDQNTIFPTPEQDLELAILAVENGDLFHAAHHIACALSVTPNNPKYLTFAAQLISLAGEAPEELIPLEDASFFGEAAFRALIHAQKAEWNEAIELILEVIGVRPDVPFIDWLETWCRQIDDPKDLDSEIISGAFQRCFDALETSELGQMMWDFAIAELYAVVKRLRALDPNDLHLGYLCSVAARRAGLHQVALSIAREVHERHPGYSSSILLAGAERARHNDEAALEAFNTALEHRPSDPALQLDVGDTLLDLGRPDEALAAYQRVLKTDPRHGWAGASALYARFLVDPHPEWRSRLESLALSGQERASTLHRWTTPYVGFLPEPFEAVIDVAAELTERGVPCGPVTFELPAPEAPSAIASAKAEVAGLGESSELIVTVRDIPDPDPRFCRSPVLYPVWLFEGEQAVAGLGLPDPEVADEIALIAEMPFDADVWTIEGKRLGELLSFVEVESILGCMIHPPPCPAQLPAWRWVVRVQVAAAMTLVGIDSGWEDSIRKRALMSLIHGPVDWATRAGIIALTELALDERHLEPLILEQLWDLWDTRPSFGGFGLEHVLVHSLLRLPGTHDDARIELEARRDELFEHYGC